MSRSVLVVDGAGHLPQLVRNALAEHHELHVVGEAAGVADALALCREIEPDLVVVDLGLPGLSDQELIAEVRKALPRALIVVVTVATEAERLARSLEHATAPVGEWTWSFPGDVGSIRSVRRRIADQLRDLGMQDRIPDLTVVVSELASNAVFHARSAFGARMDIEPSLIRMEVHDHGNGVPQPRNPRPEDLGGRGLWIVGSLASVWGTETTALGTRVWAEVPR